MLVRIIIVLIVFVCLVAILRRVRTMVGAGDRSQIIEAKMARCAHCEVYFPRGEGITRKVRAYCSPAHAAQDQVR